MTSFGDELRNLIAKKAEQFDVADALRQRQEREKERKENELDAAAAAVVRDVFRPLMQEFCEALTGAGIFRKSSEAIVARHKSGAHISTACFFGQGGQYRVRLYAAASEGRIELAAVCRRHARVRRPDVGGHQSESSGWQAVFETTDAVEENSADNPPESKKPVLLVEIAPKSIAPDPASLAAEQWARAALKKIAEACVEAGRSKT